MIATLVNTEVDMKNKRIILEQSVLTVVIIYGLAAIARIFRSYYFEFIAGLNLVPGIDRVFLYLGHIWFLLAFIFFSWAVKDEAKYFFSGLKKKNWMLALLGAITGFLMMAICITAASVSGNIIVKPASGPTDVLPFILGAVAVFIQSTTEEIESRGFIFSRLYDKSGSAPYAIIMSALIFAATHMSKPGFGLVPILTITACGLVYALSYYYFGSLWFACTNHMMWNYTQDFLFGLPNSGTPSEFSLMNTTIRSSGFCYDETFGIEGSWFSFIVMSAAALIIFIVGRYCRNKKYTDFII